MPKGIQAQEYYSNFMTFKVWKQPLILQVWLLMKATIWFIIQNLQQSVKARTRRWH